MADSKVNPTRLPIEQIGRTERPAAGRPAPDARRPTPDAAFDRVLREKLSGLKFSAHAEERIARRGIELSAGELERLRGAVDRAALKGGRDTLVLVDDKAFVVSVVNRTVVTALAGGSVREGVFTHIDSAVVS